MIEIVKSCFSKKDHWCEYFVETFVNQERLVNWKFGGSKWDLWVVGNEEDKIRKKIENVDIESWQ